MAHKTLIGGTAYKIIGGKTKVGGTTYTMRKGKTKIGGTAKSVVIERSIANTYWKLDEGYSSNWTAYSLNFESRNSTAGSGWTTFYAPFKYTGSSLTQYGQRGEDKLLYDWYNRDFGYEINGDSSYPYDSSCRYIHVIDGDDAKNDTLIDYFKAHFTQCNSNWRPL